MSSLATSAAVPRAIRPLLWWHLLSLDAPTIAVLWCAFFSIALGVLLPPSVLIAIALGVWAIYVLDRILDGFDPSPLKQIPNEHLQDRHYFYARHRRLFVPLLIAAIAVLAMLLKNGTIFLPTAFHNFLVLGISLIVYYLLIHVFRQQTRWFPKELAVGVFFSCAISVPAWARLAPAQRPGMILPALALGLLCWLNCIAITRWEARNSPLPHTQLFWLLSAACIFVSFVGVLERTVLPIFAAISASTATLIWLECNRPRFTPLALRIAADCALLTPIFVFPMLLR